MSNPNPSLVEVLTLRVVRHTNGYQQALELEDERDRTHATTTYAAKITEASRIRDLAAPYDALIREQALRIEVLQNSARERDAVIEDLEAELARFRELAMWAANIPPDYNAILHKALDLVGRLAAMHKEHLQT